MLILLFWTFLKIGILSFGGGYAMIPAIQHEVESRGWMTAEQFGDAVTLSGMAPGPLATNCAIYIGDWMLGLPGAAAALLGMVMPSAVLVVAVARFFFRIRTHRTVKSVFYGLRPVVAAMVVVAALRFGFTYFQHDWWTWKTAVSAGIFGLALLGLTRYRMHPLSVILLCALVGVAIYG
ncbi:chromate transporter [Paenibacillus sp. FJAT-26967]|uniref:chromate transporter n=1 Tax=Paenibacillus sp. FJAT-26967 TaxID=1729690 RepID=UPI000838B849|nr:chromate transporter [Paenibacillus sp. FJAT-26967]